MSTTICRMYDSHERATRAAQALRNDSLVAFSDVSVYPASPNAGSTSADVIVADLMKLYILKRHAQAYAERIQRGGTLVTVHAPFGTATTALAILGDFDPIDSGVSDPESSRPMEWDEAAPMSSAMHLPPLIDDSQTFSKFWNVPILASPKTTSSSLGLPELSSSRGSYQPIIPLPMLSDKAAPLSSLLGLKLLLGSKFARR